MGDQTMDTTTEDPPRGEEREAASAADGTLAEPPARSNRGERLYVLNALLLIYILNFVDRGLLSIAAAPIKAELGISDLGFGFLTGFGFALLYTAVGIPVAQLAERRNRVRLIAGAVILWSLMTALSGLATTVTVFGVTIGAYWVLLACRVGVGVGEAGCTPPATSLISDHFGVKGRPAALGYYGMGVTLGVTLSSLIGGPLIDLYGWRIAFFALGLPGVLVGLVVAFTLREPRHDEPVALKVEADATPGLLGTLAYLTHKPAYWFMIGGATVAGFCGYGIMTFQTLYIVRTFGVTTGEAAIWFNTPSNLAGAVGTLLLGLFAASVAGRYRSAVAWLAAGGLLLSFPAFAFAFLTENALYCIIGLSVGGFLKYGYITAMYTIAQGVVVPRMRATATAVLLFVSSLLGYGFGPLAVGYLSDHFFMRAMAAADYGGVVDRAVCDRITAGGANLANDDFLTEAVTFCQNANAQSSEMAMVIIAGFYVLAALLFALSALRLRRDHA